MTAQKRDWRHAKRQRQKVIGFRATPEEQAQIESDAKSAGLTIGAYLRKLALDAPIPRQSRRSSVDMTTLSQLLGQLGKIGSNLNQLARQANIGLAPSAPALAEELAALKVLRAEIRQALGKDQGRDLEETPSERQHQDP